MTARRDEWRSRPGVPEVMTVPPAPAAPAPAAAPAGFRERLRAIGQQLISIGSQVSSVQWSLTFLGVLGYIFASTTYRLPIGAASVFVALAGIVLLPGRFRFPSSAGFFLAFLLWALFGALLSRWSSVSLETAYELTKVFLIFVAMTNALRTRSQAWFFMVFFLFCFGTHPARGTIINYFTGNTLFGRAGWYMGTFDNFNDLAALTLLQLSMAVALLMTEKWGIVRLGALAGVLIFPFMILVTQSRGVFLALGLFTLLSVMGMRRKLRGIMLLAAIGGLLVLISPEGVWQRLRGLRNLTHTENLRSVDQEGSAEQRYLLLQAGLQIASDNPVLGVGVGTIAYANGDVSAVLASRDAHNTYITLAAENGIPGLVLFLFLVGATVLRSRRVRKRVRDSLPSGAEQLRYLELGLICFCAAGFFGSYSKLSFLYVHIALIWALAAACEDEDNRARLLAMAPVGMR
jgi:putative inorganic carbon (HCO3(-)) transporter